MSKVLAKFFNNGFVVVLAAILAGVLAMALLFFLFRLIEGGDPAPAGVSQASAVPESVQPAESLESYFLLEEKIPLPFLSRDDGRELGFDFFDVTIEVKGEEAYTRGTLAMDNLIQAFMREINEKGVGKANQPGIVDYDRLTEILLALASEEVGRDYIAEVRVTDSDDD